MHEKITLTKCVRIVEIDRKNIRKLQFLCYFSYLHVLKTLIYGSIQIVSTEIQYKFYKIFK